MVMFHPTKVPHMGFPRRVGTEGLWFKWPAPFGWRYGRVDGYGYGASQNLEHEIYPKQDEQMWTVFLGSWKLDRENMDVKIVKIITLVLAYNYYKGL